MVFLLIGERVRNTPGVTGMRNGVTFLFIPCFLLIVIGLTGFSSAEANWEEVWKSGTGLTLLSIDCSSPYLAWTCGINEASNTSQIWFTDDSGRNFEKQYSGMDLTVFMLDIDFGDASNGWVAGTKVIGFPAEGCAAVTHDGGKTWGAIKPPVWNIIVTFQSVFALDAQNVIFTGTWLTGKGVAVSKDGGSSLDFYNLGDDVVPRYSFFLNANEGWMTCGTWPEEESDAEFYMGDPAYSIWAEERPYYWSRFENDPNPLAAPMPKPGNRGDQYEAQIYHTVDGGKHWELQYTSTGEFYLNDIWFKDNQKGFAVGEASSTSFILKTTDGGRNWNKVHFASENDHGLTDILFTDNNNGWAFGMGAGSGGQPETAILYTTDGGFNWYRDPLRQPSGIMYGAFHDAHRGYTAGGNNLKVSRVIRFCDGAYGDTPSAPTATPTATPTPGPATATPTRTPTPEPGATSTPTTTPEPATPTPPQFETGIDIWTNQTMYRAGDEFLLQARCMNAESDSLMAEEYIILDVYSSYWFWPSWTPDIEFWPIALDPYSFKNQTILQFMWPSGAGKADNIRFWAAMMTPGGGELIGKYSACSFGFM